MAAIYVMCALFIILTNFERVGESFNTIFTMAFNPPSIKDPAIGVAALEHLFLFKYYDDGCKKRFIFK